MTKTWFITGAARGFGRLLTEKLLARGDKVFATVRREGSLTLEHPNLRVLHMDLTDPASIRGSIDAAFREGRIDVIIANAGYGLFGAAEELSDAAISRQIATNLTGAIDLVRAALPHLRGQQGGRFLQVSSEGGQLAYPGFSLYHATKWGIEGFIEAVAQEVAGFGIEMTLIEPGPTATEFATSVDMAQTIPAYEESNVGAVRRDLRAIAEGGTGDSFAGLADAGRSVDAMIALAEQQELPRRLVLGSTAFDNIGATLRARLSELKAQRDVPLAAD
ncbi:SDR family oxidoreductase [Allosediminivita pacifica]|uniref:NADP-dependent 3-hydroxy acid dehydrogenase YdfG n=1 Tax=Allosediminivita pacifica TaxID=1267769 RepID=A0A2T6B5W1_9RHOB|nr:SDR family oxidoreductase [Allosediminivita pacifica]PTX51466.1 NADP-dependent 3-hydroxy acid dehydrogenase YdfG [Allosediminivita pacifica]GGB00051.1 short-chain dehydrogenase/reductase [Allosediminivita pacifica]